MGESSNFVLKRIGTYDLTGSKLGKGNFAYVELATNRITKSKVAMKVIDTRKIKDEYVKKNILREALLLKKVNHPNIVRLYETLKQNSIYCIVTEYVPGGELLSYLRSQNDCKLSESQARPFMRQLISALYHMHEQGIVHRDLKMENILLDENKTNIKIVDFGLSNICRGDDLLKTQCGSPEYAAPELFKRGCRYGTEVDLWSLGVIMYAIVVGRLPFRSPHYGSRGRNELIEQTSRGLSCMHNKYLVRLTHHCRDLLAKLLKPRPELRLPLLDVMVHPWVTVQGTSPLVPFTEQPIDEKIQDKVLEKVSQLIKIHKSKIALHVHQKRYDAITGVYNLLLDEELKCASKSNNERRVQRENTRANSVIKVSIKSTAIETANQKTGDQNRLQDSESSSRSEGQDSQPEAEKDWEQTTTQKPIISKPQENLVERLLEGLQIKAIKMCSFEERGLSNSHTHANTRPNSATPARTYIESPLKPTSGPPRAWKRANRARCNSCIPRFAPKFDSKLHGKRVVMSPRRRQEPECLASQWESKLSALITEVGEEGCSHCEDLKSTASSSGENSPEKNSTEVQPEKPDAQLEFGEKTEIMSQENLGSSSGRMGPKNCHLKDTPGLKPSPETSKSEGKQTAQILQTSPKSVTSKRVIWSHKGMPPSSLASQTINRAVSPLRASQFVDLTDYHKHVPQPPKARIAGQLGCGTKLGCKEGEDEGQINSFSAAYNSYLKISKPQHRRLSIMQAQEILQHESKFQLKYGRKLNAAEISTSNTDSNKSSDNQVSRLDNASNSTHASVPVAKKSNKQQYNIPKPGYLKGVKLHGDQREIILDGVKQEIIFEKQAAPSQDRLVGPNLSAERGYNEESKIKNESEKGNEIQVHSIDILPRPTRPSPEAGFNHPTPETRLNPKQEESLKRQKEKEQTENHEREKKKFLKELEDQQRQKMITEYLQHVYSQYGRSQPSPRAVNKPELNPRTYKVSNRGRVYSVTTRPAEKPGSDAPRVITRPTSILHQAAKGAQGDKKIVFKTQTGVKATNGVRFVNDWNNSVFTEYINSSDVDTTDGKENDKLQVKDASFWLEQHLNGVLDETTVTRKDLHNYQQLYIPRET